MTSIMTVRMKSRFDKISKTYRISSSAVKTCMFAPLIIVFLFHLFLSLHSTRRAAHLMLSENYPVELLTFVSLLCAGIMGLKLALKMKKHGKGILTVSFYAVFSAGLIFVAMEEISWGQWFFGFDTPLAVKAINRQREMNFHNIKVFHAPFEFLRVLFGLGGLLSIWLAAKKSTKYIGSPAFLAPWYLMITVLAALDFHNYFERPWPKTIFFAAAQLVELLELLIGISALLYMWFNNRIFESKSEE